MSKWNDQYNNHPFQTVWASLKDSLDKSTLDDDSVVTAVSELARLKKVIVFVDEMLSVVDPELVPVSIWQSFNAQATPCRDQINNFNSNRNIAHIVQANAHADNLLNYVRPYMVLPKDVLKSVKRAGSIYSKTIEESLETFQSKSREIINKLEDDAVKATSLLETIKPIKLSVEKLNSELFDEEGVKNNILKLAEDSKVKSQNISNAHKEILIGDENEVSIKKAISLTQEKIVEEREKIEKLLATVVDEVSNLGDFHTKIFGVLGEGDQRAGGLSDELNMRLAELTSFEKSQKLKYKALNEEIESLLPGATSAGLASAYMELKESFDQPIKNASRVFLGALVILFLSSLFLTIESFGGDRLITFVKIGALDTVLIDLLYKIPFYAPVLWLAFYATKRRSEYQRLQQEYAHKEALAKSYNSYKKQIKELGDDDKVMQKEFIMKTIDAIAHNASSTLDGQHGDKILAHEFFDSAVKAAVKLKG